MGSHSSSPSALGLTARKQHPFYPPKHVLCEGRVVIQKQRLLSSRCALDTKYEANTPLL